jgi:hypothetical protein
LRIPGHAPLRNPTIAPLPVLCVDPKPFKGNRKELKAFLEKCQMKFNRELNCFSIEDEKALYACS